ncbi:MAG TPA: hypothetical protein DCM23_02945 [Firmicutes bacterium]|jgi:hypothetical protein|nr:hypothetical protein [Bacillota bacterium]
MFKYRQYFERLSLNAHHETIKILVFNIFVIPFSIMFGLFTSWIGGIISSGIGIMLLNLFLSQGYQLQIEKNAEMRIMAFIDAFTIVKIFINNNYNVYRAIEETIRYVKPILKDDLTRLLEDIDIDKSVQPFVKFARTFAPLIIEELMIGLYQLDIQGGSRQQLEGFDYMFNQFETHKTNDQRRRYDDRLDSMNMWPLIGAGLIAIDLLIGVIEIIMRAISEL